MPYSLQSLTKGMTFSFVMKSVAPVYMCFSISLKFLVSAESTVRVSSLLDTSNFSLHTLNTSLCDLIFSSLMIRVISLKYSSDV